jgi:hypothetical protein
MNETLADDLVGKFLTDEPLLSGERAVKKALQASTITGIRLIEDENEIQSLLIYGGSFDAEGTDFRNINDSGRRTAVMQFLVNEFRNIPKINVRSCHVSVTEESGDELAVFFETDWVGETFSLEMDWFLFEQQRFACRAMANKYFIDVAAFALSYY